MKNQELTQELQEEFKKGNLKPSQLKKSKSADQLLPKSVPLTKSKSAGTFADPKYPYTTLISQGEELEALKKESETKSTTIALLRKKNAELEKQVIPIQEQNEALLTELANVYEQLNELKESSSEELDQALIARQQNLKDWFKEYQKTKKLDKELIENIEEVSEELTSQDQLLTKLRSENSKLKQTNQSLQRDLELTQKLAESRKVPYFENDSGLSYFKYGIYALLAVGFCLFLKGKNNG